MRTVIITLLLFGITVIPAEGADEAKDSATAYATFAGGCFWCMEPPFDHLEGVVATISGYAGGHVKHPTYQEVSVGSTGHAEVIQIEFDPDIVSYEELLSVFWRNIDPTAKDRQFCDRGTQYRSVIFFHDEAQRVAGEQSKTALENNNLFLAPIVTEIAPLEAFYPAESYHQNYYKKNPIKYKYYRYRCGRDKRLKELWGGDR